MQSESRSDASNPSKHTLHERLAAIQRELRAHPRNAGLWVQRARCLLEQGHRFEVLEACRLAEECMPEDPAVWDAIGGLRGLVNDQLGALVAYERAVSLAPGEPHYLFNRATVRRFLGDLAGAESDYDAVIAFNPNDDEAYLNRSELRTQTAERNHIEQIESRLRTSMTSWRGFVQLHYALAKELEDLGAYARAFQVLKRGAQHRRAHMRYEVATDLTTVDWIREAYPLAKPADADSAPDNPVFIVGLPRSGTTLVERILGNHSALSPAGELDCFAQTIISAVAGRGGVPPDSRQELVRRSAQVDFAKLGRNYMERARSVTGLTARFIDKMPLNYLYCGLIARALPNARIIQMERHPMALGYAIFKTLFKNGYPFSYDLKEIGQYLGGYRRLMRHWHNTLTTPILQVPYEEVVCDFERQTRRFLSHCNLAWEDGCVDFRENPHSSQTASAAQVRQPLYSRSLDQWRHYAKELIPLREALLASGFTGAELD